MWVVMRPSARDPCAECYQGWIASSAFTRGMAGRSKEQARETLTADEIDALMEGGEP